MVERLIFCKSTATVPETSLAIFLTQNVPLSVGAMQIFVFSKAWVTLIDAEKNFNNLLFNLGAASTDLYTLFHGEVPARWPYRSSATSLWSLGQGRHDPARFGYLASESYAEGV